MSKEQVRPPTGRAPVAPGGAPAPHRRARRLGLSALSGLAALLLLTGQTPEVRGDVYRWVDEQGVTQFSQTAPPARPYQTLRLPAQSAPDSEAETSLEQRREQLDGWQRARKEDRQKQRESAEDAAQRRKNCENARTNLDSLENLGTRMLKMPDGEYTRPSDEQLETLKQESREQIKTFCD